MKVISFNANGIKAAAEAGFYDWALAQDPDIIAISNIEAQEYDLVDNVFWPREYNTYIFDDVKRNSNGVMIYCKKLPKAIMTGLAMGDLDQEGRYIQADFDKVSIGCILAPYANTDDDAAQSKKNNFFTHLLPQLEKVRHKRRDYVICGNFNVAHSDIDVQYPDDHENQTSGFLDHERDWLDEVFGMQEYVDAFREINFDPDEFTWWPDGERGENGWRVDYQIVSRDLRNEIRRGYIYTEQVFGDHAPVVMEYNVDL